MYKGKKKKGVESDEVFGGGGNFLLDIIVAWPSEGVGPSGKVFFNFSRLHIVRSSAPFTLHSCSISLECCLFFSPVINSTIKIISVPFQFLIQFGVLSEHQEILQET